MFNSFVLENRILWSVTEFLSDPKQDTYAKLFRTSSNSVHPISWSPNLRALGLIHSLKIQIKLMGAVFEYIKPYYNAEYAKRKSKAWASQIGHPKLVNSFDLNLSSPHLPNCKMRIIPTLQPKCL